MVAATAPMFLQEHPLHHRQRKNHNLLGFRAGLLPALFSCVQKTANLLYFFYFSFKSILSATYPIEEVLVFPYVISPYHWFLYKKTSEIHQTTRHLG